MTPIFKYRKGARMVGWMSLALAILQLLMIMDLIYFSKSDPYFGDLEKIEFWTFVALSCMVISKFVKVFAAIALTFAVEKDVDKSLDDAFSLIRYWERVTKVLLVVDPLAVVCGYGGFTLILFEVASFAFLNHVKKFSNEVGDHLEQNKEGSVTMAPVHQMSW